RGDGVLQVRVVVGLAGADDLIVRLALVEVRAHLLDDIGKVAREAIPEVEFDRIGDGGRRGEGKAQQADRDRREKTRRMQHETLPGVEEGESRLVDRSPASPSSAS